MYLSFINFTGNVDLGVFTLLYRLEELVLSGLSVNVDSDKNYTFPSLGSLSLQDCSLREFPNISSTLNRGLTTLDLSSNMIYGEIPGWLWEAGRESLFSIDISNNFLTGGTPRQIPLWKLDTIGIVNNLLQGQLPAPPPSMTAFYAAGNRFDGDIPSLICNASSLLMLTLSENNLTGSIPQCLANLTVCDLKILGDMALSDNFFNGRIPECIGNISSLSGLALRNNQLEGSLPPSLVNCTRLTSVDIGHNMINDTFPFWMESLPILQTLKLDSNKLHGPLDKFVAEFSFPSLFEINLAHNDLRGHLSTKPFKSAHQVDLSNNKFDGSVPIPGARTLLYSLSNNKFAGVSSSICNASDLEVLNLSNNSLSGTIPNCLTSSNTSLSVLNLRMNYFQGELPEILGGNSSLRTLDFSRNRLDGVVPRSLLNCQMLEVLDLSYNMIEDTFPRWLGSLPKLQVLVPKLNNFDGSVQSPDADYSFPKLQILDLSSSHFGGPLSSEFIECLQAMMTGSEIALEKILTTFTTVDLSNNNFQMEIPDAIGKLISLRGLNLSGNNITGHIPQSIGNLANLEWLDLSTNKLSRRIPGELKDLTALSFLNFSGNQLFGPIPQGNQFNTFDNDSFAGNLGLCGFPLSKACDSHENQPPPPSIPEEDSARTNIFDWKIILMGYGCGLIGGLSMGYIVFQTRRPEWFVRMFEEKFCKRPKRPRKNLPRFHGR
ncbi:receptor-like protein 7 [Syzygium oleosum]|uniref:receptor-like protein 7 n=1 Tax=Syzygium oleosum TaxID=219896 RepID=UPI0024BAB535|nr:receptor-like protein 7 [Syzygium oleosum]